MLHVASVWKPVALGNLFKLFSLDITFTREVPLGDKDEENMTPPPPFGKLPARMWWQILNKVPNTWAFVAAENGSVEGETSRNFLVTRFMEEMSYVFSFTIFFFTAAHFHLALVAASISYFVTAATKFSCCSSNKKMSPLFFIPRSRPLSPFFSLSFAGLPPAFSFSLSFSCSLFQICGNNN